MRLKQFTASIAVLALSACVSRTPYQPYNEHGGYSERRVDAETQVARFAGNAATKAGEASLFSQLRAVEVCQGQGFRYARIIDVKDLSVTQVASEKSEAQTLPIFETYFSCTNLTEQADRSTKVIDESCRDHDLNGRTVCRAGEPRHPASR